MPLIEIIPHSQTEAEVCSRAEAFYKSLGERTILVKQEVPGFVANRLQAVLSAEAWSLVERGIASAEDVDACMSSGLGLRWAFTGLFMTSAMLVGGGKAGFARLLTHLTPAAKFWIDDMKAHAFQFTDQNIQKISDSVGNMLENVDADQVQMKRDRLLFELLRQKEEEGMI